LDIVGKRRSDAYGALAFLAGQTFVDPQRVAAVGFSHGGWVTLLAAEANSFELFVRQNNMSFRAVVAFYPPCRGRSGAPGDTHAHSYWSPRRMDAGGRLLREN
jgi:dienelactone hydrolase